MLLRRVSQLSLFAKLCCLVGISEIFTYLSLIILIHILPSDYCATSGANWLDIPIALAAITIFITLLAFIWIVRAKKGYKFTISALVFCLLCIGLSILAYYIALIPFALCGIGSLG